MKKTLIALAVLAASGASFAQVAITGSLIMGYKATKVADSEASGLGVDTSEINFAATEDLGGGLKATAKLGLAGADRSNESTGIAGSNKGRDASLAIAGGFGSVTLGATRSVDYLSGGVSGVAGIGLDEKIFSARGQRDTLSVSLPVGPVSLLLSHQEADRAIAAGAAADAGLGQGATGSSAQRVSVIGLTYAAGALTANGQYLSYDNRTNGSASSADTVTRVSGSYDFGVAKLGLGFSQANYSNNGTRKDTLVGVSAPVGSALTVGAQWGQRKQDSLNAATDGGWNSTGLTASYALSKRTSVTGTYVRWDNATAKTTDNEFSLLVGHSF